MNTVAATLDNTACAGCGVHRASNLRKLGLAPGACDYIIALAGNPNTGKSTVFNAITGLRQHTGNWPGKTVTRAEGGYEYAGDRFKLVDLPGAYSLLSASLDEQIARDFILFGQPDVTVIVADAARLERNLNLSLQILEITDRVVVCLNLMDEAKRQGITVDARQLARDLGVPVVPTSARFGKGIPELLQAISDVATGRVICQPQRLETEPAAIKAPLAELIGQLKSAFPMLPNGRWVALRLLGSDDTIVAALRSGVLAQLRTTATVSASLPPGEMQAGAVLPASSPQAEAILATAQRLRQEIPGDLHEHIVEALYGQAAKIRERAVSRTGQAALPSLSRSIDRLVTSRVWGFPLMILLFSLVFWITIVGANYPSSWIASLLIERLYPILKAGAAYTSVPEWLSGLLLDGAYLATAWVVSVMLPPMAIFFPMFTLLEDLGYLPRVAFNLDAFFKKSGAHGKQALSMMMGYGCNAAGVIATRIIDSPRERLLAIITNNFALCNGRWPTQILIATLFIGSLAPAHWAGLISATAVVGIALLGVLLTFLVSWVLSRTVLRGQVSTFSLELPPYRPPRLLQTVYTSIIDRTLFVLFRAVVFAAPAGAVIWLTANLHIGGASVATHMINLLGPLGALMGLNGVILLAYIVAIPANEIVVPTILMLTVLTAKLSGVGEGAGVMFEADEASTKAILVGGGWTLMTAVNLLLFSLAHNPCSTTILTIWKETRSVKWTTAATFLPLVTGIVLCALVTFAWRLLA